MPLGANVGFSAARAEPAYQPWADPVSDEIGRSPWDRPPRFASPVQPPPVLPMRGPDGWHYPGAQLDPTPPTPPKDFRTRLLEALSDENIRYYAGPHLYDLLRKFAPLAQQLPGSGTVQSTEDGAKAGEEFEAGNYGSAAAHLGTGMGNAALDWFPPLKYALFGGMSARTFPRQKLPIAEAMERAGNSVDDIWRATGLERDAARNWRFEISDAPYRVNPNAGILNKDGIRVAPLFRQQIHPDLQMAYPSLAKAKSLIRIDPLVARKGRAWFNPGLVGLAFPTESVLRQRGVDVPIESLLQHYGIHELQHMINYLERFARGGSEAEFRARGFSKVEAKDLYNRLVGEVEARNAQLRLRLDEEYRRRWSPLSTERLITDIPRDQQIILPYSDLFP